MITASMPTLVSSRQPWNSAVRLPGCSASQTAPSMATAAIANQTRVGGVIMPGRLVSAARAGQLDGLGRQAIDGVLGGNMPLTLAHPPRRWIRHVGRQRLHEL